MDAATGEHQLRELSGRDELSEHELALLEFEDRTWRNPGTKEQEIRLQFGISAARYYQLLNALIDSPAAARYDPLLVGRLRRMRSGRTTVGAGR